VAGDLHDELGSTLNSVKIFANLALLEKDNTTHLEKIKESTQSAISGVKDIIWVLDDKRDTLDHLLGRIDQFARPICEAAGISYKQQSGGNENYKLGKEEKRNLYMIIKESINNSIKYSDCTLIELLIKNTGGKLNISISDNGKGFDKDKIASGYGLRNIVHRSKEIEYHAEINSYRAMERLFTWRKSNLYFNNTIFDRIDHQAGSCFNIKF
jgi:signal transduction histidine kinase